MRAILRRIGEVGVQYKINMTEYETPPLQTAVDTEQIRNVQDSERYAIHISSTKIFNSVVQFYGSVYAYK